jgi:hypothetical protein
LAFVFKKISDYGTSNPIVARTSIQIRELMQPYGLGEEKEAVIFGTFFTEVRPRLIRCMEISNRIFDEVENIIGEINKNGLQMQSQGNVVHLPHVTQLTEDVETFLYNSKSALRDVAKIFFPLFGKEFDHCKYNEISDWTKVTFGEASPLYRLIVANQGWIKDVVCRRNAVEHPGGYSGHLYIYNFELDDNDPTKSLMPPRWHRNKDAKTLLHNDLPVMLENILRFSEDLLAVSLIQVGSKFPMVIYEVPEEERSPEMPIRLKVTVDVNKLKFNGVP